MHSNVSAYSLFWVMYMDRNSIFQLEISFLLLFSMVLLWMKTFRRPLDSRIPVFKFPSWSVLGNMPYCVASSRVIQQASLNINAYFLQSISGLSIIYRKKDIFCVWIAFRPFLILNKIETVEKMLRSNTLLEKAMSYKWFHPFSGLGLLTSGGSKWRMRRKILTPAFHFDILKDFLPIFNENAKILVDILKTQCDENWIDLFHYTSLCSLDIICESSLGMKINAQLNSDSEYPQRIRRVLDCIMDRISTPKYWIDFIYYMLPVGRQFKKDVKFCHEVTRKIIEEKKATILKKNETTQNISTTGLGIRKRKAFLDLLLDIHLSDQSLTEKDLREEVDTFTAAGYETTSTTLGWTLYLLGLHPEVQTKVHEELDEIFGYDSEREVTAEDLKEMHYLECVINETLRLYPTVPVIGRHIKEDGEFHGYHVRKGTTLMVFPHILHLNPEYFPNPEKFDPSRFQSENYVGRRVYNFIPFSAGPRNCIGKRFAIMEEKTVLAHILRNFTLRSLEPRDRVISSGQISLQPVHPVKMKLSKRDICFNGISI